MSFWILKAGWWMWPDIWLMEPSIHAYTWDTDHNSPTDTEGVNDPGKWSLNASTCVRRSLQALLKKRENI